MRMLKRHEESLACMVVRHCLKQRASRTLCQWDQLRSGTELPRALAQYPCRHAENLQILQQSGEEYTAYPGHSYLACEYKLEKYRGESWQVQTG